MQTIQHTDPEQHRRAGTSGLRNVVAAHPVASYLAIMFTVAWGVLFPLTLNDLPPEPGLLVVVFLGQLAPACAITGVVSGRPAVRELLSRTFRWRVHPGWYLLAVFGLPAAIVAGAVAVRGPSAIFEILSDPGLLTSYLSGLAIVPLINLWEETGWMGFVQARLEESRTPLRAAVITAFFFAALHTPLFVTTGSRKGFLIALLVTSAFAVPFRVVIGWLYHRSGASILIVAIAHAGFNAANDGDLTKAMWPDAWPTTVAPVVLAVSAGTVLLTTRGRVTTRREEQRPAAPAARRTR